MRILYHFPNPSTIYAGRTIYNGYKNAFRDLGHTFKTLTPDSDLKKLLIEYNPHIFITSLNALSLKFLDLGLVEKSKKKGVKVFINVPFWNSPMSKLRINEAPSLSRDKNKIRLIKSDSFGDIYFNSCIQGDQRMDGFEKETGYFHYTVPLAADKTIIFPSFDRKFKADISFVGTMLPEKMGFFDKYVYPLKQKYVLKLYGQDWTFFQRILSTVQKVGQYFNLPIIKSLIKPALKLSDERKIYSSSIISINIHEEYQRKFGGDCNERTFKIPLAQGFEITDDVKCITNYFEEGSEIIVAKNGKDWVEKINYYLKYPEKRIPIIKAGQKKVLQKHTYHNRVEQFIKIYQSL